DGPTCGGTSYGGAMGVFGELFPGPKIRREAGEAGSGQQWRLGPIDLDKGVVELQAVPAEDEGAADPGVSADPVDERAEAPDTGDGTAPGTREHP
ncbi:MAG TPA: hypothetical protein VD813_09175, partial [Pseudonocardia sp.]|nr:hypothetical protein [Pseudonocardia sp.]